MKTQRVQRVLVGADSIRDVDKLERAMGELNYSTLTPSPSPTTWERGAEPRGAGRSPSPAWRERGLGGEGRRNAFRRGKLLLQNLRHASLVLGLLLAIGVASAQSDTPQQLDPGAFGTRAGAPMQRVAAPEGSSLGWAQLGVALLIVAAGLRWGLPKLLRWAGKTGDGSPVDGQIKIIETRSALGGSLMLVKARDRLLLIGATAQGMQLLADLTDTLPKPEPAIVSESAFETVLRRAQPVAPPPDLQAEAAAQVQTRLRQTRARLQSLLGGEV